MGVSCLAKDGDCYGCGEDAFLVAANEDQSVIAVADGVGGWRKRGIDPSVFSRSLMTHLSSIISSSSEKISFSPSSSQATFKDEEKQTEDPVVSKRGYGIAPVTLIKSAFWRMVLAFQHGLERPFGSSTVCVLSLASAAGVIETANIGDSGFLLIRPESDEQSVQFNVIFKSPSQQHRFNAPYQLSLRPPDGIAKDVTDAAALGSFSVRPGDLVVLASDGLWDNLHVHDVVSVLSQCLRNPLMQQSSKPWWRSWTSLSSLSPLSSSSSSSSSLSTTKASAGVQCLHVNKSSLPIAFHLDVQWAAQCLLAKAKEASKREAPYQSPFSMEAAKHGVLEYADGGGKEDDITVLVAQVDH